MNLGMLRGKQQKGAKECKKRKTHGYKFANV